MRTPVRVSFLGGGTDYPDHFRRFGGQTLGVAIDRYSFVTVNTLARLFDYEIRVSYSRTELVKSPDEIEHPAVRECLRLMRIERGLEIHYVGDLPARTGLGSSSSFTVALLHALHALKGEMVSQRQLAEEACHVEHEMIRERVGVQDQYICAHGGLLHLLMEREGNVSVRRMPLSRDRLRDLAENLVLLYTGIRRNAHEVLEEQLQKTRTGELSGELSKLAGLVDQGIDVLTGSSSLSAFGELLHAAWCVKRQLSEKISNTVIDAYYDVARRNGAIGGKLLGAGGGGFLLLFVPPDRKHAVLSAMPQLVPVDFGFDSDGSQVIFYQPR